MSRTDLISRLKNHTNHMGLINGKIPGRPETDENTFLFTNVYDFVNGGETSTALRNSREDYLDFMLRDGWYKNVVPEDHEVADTHKKDLHLSRDQMYSYSVYSKLNGRKDHETIWRTIYTHGFTYDRITKRFNIRRIVRPKDWIFLGSLNGNIICRFLMPWYYLVGIFTFAFGGSTGTSGEQLYYHNYFADDHLLKKPFYLLYELMMVLRFGSKDPWRSMLGVYYGMNHPIYRDGIKYDLYKY